MKLAILQTLKSLPKKILWVLPFISFIMGYTMMKVIIPSPTIAIPSVVGKNLLDTIETLSSCNLTAKIITKKEDSTLQEIKIIQQIPVAGTHVKPRQTVHLIIAEPKQPMMMPDMARVNEKNLEVDLRNYKKITIPLLSHQSTHSAKIIAQFPEIATPIDYSYTLYTAAPEDLYTIPNFNGYSVFEAETMLKQNNIPYKLHEQGRRPFHSLLDTAQIIAQQPKAGTVFSLQKPPILHLTIEY
jgi:beta-lactam-binding protein with PASTA domain